MSAGSIPATGAFFIEQPISRFEREAPRTDCLMEFALRKGKPIGDGSRLESGRALTLPCEFDSIRPDWSPFRCNRRLCHWPIGKGASLPSWTGGFDSRMALSTNLFGDRLTVGYLTLNQVIEVRILFPELSEVRAVTSLCPSHYLTRGSNCW